MKIGIIGQGFVGNAVYQKFKNYFDILTYDIDETKCNSDFHYIKKGCDTIFLCLPTPMYEDGTCNTSIVEIMLSQINGYGPNKSYDIVIKSTIPPGTTEEWNERFEKLNIVFNPEFLTEANAVSDYENQNRIILGGPRPATTRLKRIFTKVFPKAHIIKTGSRHAEMVKYVTNAFLATKVSFANEMYQICQALDIDYDKVIEYAQHDDRLGTSHWAVPGPDGDFGYGGHCFPKDVKALISLANKYSLDPKILTAVDSKNNDVRNDRDWEKMKGRAIT
jgi:UDPglucose 6-dehydrogenase|tara:strand:+ start:311 stop:1141 length:831 start_codon:yes stop_codon:yes gene_type:complete